MLCIRTSIKLENDVTYNLNLLKFISMSLYREIAHNIYDTIKIDTFGFVKFAWRHRSQFYFFCSRFSEALVWISCIYLDSAEVFIVFASSVFVYKRMHQFWAIYESKSIVSIRLHNIPLQQYSHWCKIMAAGSREANRMVTAQCGESLQYCDVTWTSWCLKSPATQLFLQLLFHAHIKKPIKAPCHWLWGKESTGDR